MKNQFNQGFNKTGLKNSKALELVFILDRSGSMSGKTKIIENQYNNFIKKLQRENKNYTITTILFGDIAKIIIDGKHVRDIKAPLRYDVDGATAEYDAIGCAIDYINERKKNPKNPNPDADVLYTLVTDGEENSSSIFDQPTIQQKIALERENTVNGKRDFMALCEYNIDKNLVVGGLGLDKTHAQIYVGTENGVETMFKTIEVAIADVIKNNGKLSPEFQKESDKLTIDGVPLAQVNTFIDKTRALFDTFEKQVNGLEKLAMADGLSQAFYTEFLRVRANLAQLRASSAMTMSNKGFVGTIVGDFVETKARQLEFTKQVAGKAEVTRIMNANEMLFTSPDNQSFKTIAQNLEKCEYITAELFRTTNASDLTVRMLNQTRRFQAIASNFTHKSAPANGGLDPKQAQIVDDLANMKE